MNGERGWQPSASLATLEQRARLLSLTRDFFAARDVLEVETSVLAPYAVSDTFIASLPAADGQWLRTSPEHQLKRFLAAHRRDVYELARVFRRDEQGRLHQPEFTLVEWYRQGYSLTQLAAETVELIGLLLGSHPAASVPAVTHEYRACFVAATGLDPTNATASELRDCARNLLNTDTALADQLGDDRASWLDLLASHCVYPALPANQLHIVCGYPAAQAMLAQLDPDDPQRALRFEVFVNGIELANGFVELRDAAEQRQRFAADNERRQRLGLPIVAADELLLAALAHGMPACAGVAVGFDRVVMLAGNADSVAATQAFTANSRPLT